MSPRSFLLRSLLLPALLLPGGCLVKVPVADPVYTPCRALSSADWRVGVEKLPMTRHTPPIRKWRLIVDGRVTVPTGYAAGLARGPVEKLRDPVQQILVRTEGGPETGPPQTLAVHADFPALKRYGAVRIRCGDETLAILKDVRRIG